MSDSEEDNAFKSADEGDGADADSKNAEMKPAKENLSSSGTGSTKSSKEPAAKADTNGGTSQDKNQGKSRNKKKRGKGAQQVSKDDKEAAIQKEKQQAGQSEPAKDKTDIKSSVEKQEETHGEEHADDETHVKTEEKPTKVEEKSDTSKSDTPPSESKTKTEAVEQDADSEKDNLEAADAAAGTESPSEENDSHTAKALFDKLAEERAIEQSTGWGWGGWGSSLLNTVQTSVDTFASSVGEGLQTVMETAETALGAPTAEELAQQKKIAKEVRGDALETPVEEKEEPFTTSPPKQEMIRESSGEEQAASESKESESKEPSGDGGEGGGAGWLGGWGAKATSWGSGLTQKLQNTSKTLVTGTLDVLETVGKKTYETLAEGDHGLKQVLHIKENKANLSQVLREAKESAEREAKLEEEFVESRKAHFGAMFDEYQGLVHLEALEMLSNQCESKVQSILSTISVDQLQPIKTDLITIKDAFVVEDLEDAEDTEDQDFAALVTDADAKLDVGASSAKLIQVQEKCRTWAEKCIKEQGEGNIKEAKEIHQTSIQSMADLTARAVEHFHKAGELVLLKKGTMTVNVARAQALASLTRVLCTEVGIMSTKFTQCLTTAADNSEEPDAINPLITNVYLEAGNSSTYIQDAFQLLLPVLQQATLEGWS